MSAALVVATLLAWPVHGIAAPPPAGATACSGCHARSEDAASPIPRLAGADPVQMLRAMQDFRAGTRPATVMDRIARGFGDDEIRAIAAWYVRRK